MAPGPLRNAVMAGSGDCSPLSVAANKICPPPSPRLHWWKLLLYSTGIAMSCLQRLQLWCLVFGGCVLVVALAVITVLVVVVVMVVKVYHSGLCSTIAFGWRLQTEGWPGDVICRGAGTGYESKQRWRWLRRHRHSYHQHSPTNIRELWPRPNTRKPIDGRRGYQHGIQGSVKIGVVTAHVGW